MIKVFKILVLSYVYNGAFLIPWYRLELYAFKIMDFAEGNDGIAN